LAELVDYDIDFRGRTIMANKKTTITKAHQAKMKSAVHAALAKATPAGVNPSPPVMYVMDTIGPPVQPKIKICVLVSVLVAGDSDD
jgi:hypothetical protein